MCIYIILCYICIYICKVYIYVYIHVCMQYVYDIYVHKHHSLNKSQLAMCHLFYLIEIKQL